MQILFIGGTVFVGRHMVETALERGHEVTLFHRGQRNPDVFPQVERILGNRDGGLEPLRGRRFDVVIDTCGFIPRVVRASAELFADQADRYVFISSVSVYADFTRHGQDEDAPLGTLADPSVEVVDGDTYGPLKVLCEQAVEAAFPGRALLIRPGLIVGPHDVSDRFTYWPRRVAQGGEVLAPASPEVPVQFIDVRDLAEWTIRMVEARATGAFNATGPATPLTLGPFLETCRETTGSDARFTWVPEKFLLEREVRPYLDLPLWVPEESAGLDAVSVQRAMAAGLTFRPLETTIRDTLAWDAARPAGTPRRAGLTEDRERTLLEAWHAADPAARPEAGARPDEPLPGA